MDKQKHRGCKESSDSEQKLANQNNSFPLCSVRFYLSIEVQFLRLKKFFLTNYNKQESSKSGSQESGTIFSYRVSHIFTSTFIVQAVTNLIIYCFVQPPILFTYLSRLSSQRQTVPSCLLVVQTIFLAVWPLHCISSSLECISSIFSTRKCLSMFYSEHTLEILDPILNTCLSPKCSSILHRPSICSASQSILRISILYMYTH